MNERDRSTFATTYEFFRYAKIGELDHSVLVDEDVAALHILQEHVLCRAWNTTNGGNYLMMSILSYLFVFEKPGSLPPLQTTPDFLGINTRRRIRQFTLECETFRQRKFNLIKTRVGGAVNSMSYKLNLFQRKL